MSIVVKGKETVSSSRSFYNCSPLYDVFLSFRGADTRTSFTDHLYSACWAAGIRTFRDGDELQIGKNIRLEIDWAIKQSKTSVIVFSKNYADSKWCLDELVLILECRRSFKHEVIPVFYNIKPCDVRKQTGCFAKSFARYENQIKLETNHQSKKQLADKVKAWRTALEEVADLVGMNLDDKHETKFIQEIVGEIVKKLNQQASVVQEHQFTSQCYEEVSHYKELAVGEHLTGLDDRVKPIESWLRDASAKAAVLVLRGMSGIGKTTIAKCVYNSNFKYFDGCCFLADIEQNSKRTSDLHLLQSQILSDILNWPVDLKHDMAEGMEKIRYALSTKRILLVFDDVRKLDLVHLLLKSQPLHQGTKIIITTRDFLLPKALKICHEVHTIKSLNHYESMDLFCWLAFRQSKPPIDYKQQSEKLVRRCEGHPIMLQIFGSLLCRLDIGAWDNILQTLEHVPQHDVFRILCISFDSLEYDRDKNLFLDIACFFVGEDKDQVVTILDEHDLHPATGIENLVRRGLIMIDERNKLRMHSLLQDMGREIDRQELPNMPERRRRLWSDSEAFNILKENKGTDAIQGLVLNMQMIREQIDLNHEMKQSHQEFSGGPLQPGEEEIEINAFARMKNLRFLKLDHVNFTGSSNFLPGKLRWLQWHEFPLKYLPMELPLEKLVSLDLQHSRLIEVWEDLKILGSLKILNLSYSQELVRTPDFSGLPTLERLLLKSCSRLYEVSPTIGILEKLIFLDFQDCRTLRKLPRMPKFKGTLVIDGCLNLETDTLDSLILLPKPRATSEPNLSNFVHLERSNQWKDAFRKASCSLSSPKELDSSSNIVSGLLDKTQVEEVNGSRRSTTSVCWDCQKVVENEGSFKLVPVEKVDKKILNNLGLASRFDKSTEVVLFDEISNSMNKNQIQVLYEFGIFSLSVPGREVPRCQRYNLGSSISFRVPSGSNNLRVLGVNVSFVYTTSSHHSGVHPFLIKISNKTKNFTWIYHPTFFGIPKFEENLVWSSHWKIGNQLEVGDSVQFSLIVDDNYQVKECGFRIVYEEGEGSNDEAIDKPSTDLSWGDRTFMDLSNYCTKTKAVFLGCNILVDKLLYSNSLCLHKRWFHGMVEGFAEIHDVEVLTWSGPHPDWPNMYRKFCQKRLNSAWKQIDVRNDEGDGKVITDTNVVGKDSSPTVMPSRCKAMVAVAPNNVAADVRVGNCIAPDRGRVDKRIKTKQNEKIRITKLENELKKLGNEVERMRKAAAIVTGNQGCSTQEAMALLDEIPEITRLDNLFMLATRLLVNHENRDMFLQLRDSETRLAWLRQEQQRERGYPGGPYYGYRA